ncbi:hypothetical protein BC828DRAFT_406720, partial [Blastocladiella britannica]
LADAEKAIKAEAKLTRRVSTLSDGRLHPNIVPVFGTFGGKAMVMLRAVHGSVQTVQARPHAHAAHGHQARQHHGDWAWSRAAGRFRRHGGGRPAAILPDARVRPRRRGKGVENPWQHSAQAHPAQDLFSLATALLSIAGSCSDGASNMRGVTYVGPENQPQQQQQHQEHQPQQQQQRWSFRRLSEALQQDPEAAHWHLSDDVYSDGVAALSFVLAAMDPSATARSLLAHPYLACASRAAVLAWAATRLAVPVAAAVATKREPAMKAAVVKACRAMEDAADNVVVRARCLNVALENRMRNLRYRFESSRSGNAVDGIPSEVLCGLVAGLKKAGPRDCGTSSFGASAFSLAPSSAPLLLRSSERPPSDRSQSLSVPPLPPSLSASSGSSAPSPPASFMAQVVSGGSSDSGLAGSAECIVVVDSATTSNKVSTAKLAKKKVRQAFRRAATHLAAGAVHCTGLGVAV